MAARREPPDQRSRVLARSRTLVRWFRSHASGQATSRRPLVGRGTDGDALPRVSLRAALVMGQAGEFSACLCPLSPGKQG
uniref:Uncharacterized protein n=1 Tax=Leptobrachium leishanense TaxID=445787 RepID=A0A8C5QQB6_9ANUR